MGAISNWVNNLANKAISNIQSGSSKTTNQNTSNTSQAASSKVSSVTSKSSTPVGSVSQAVVSGRATPSTSTTYNQNTSNAIQAAQNAIASALSSNGSKSYNGYTIGTGTSYNTGSSVASKSGTETTSTKDTNSSSGYTPNYYSGLSDLLGSDSSDSSSILDYIKGYSEDALNALVDSIYSKLNATKSAYNNQIDDLNDQYDALVNQSEVERYKNRRAMRTSLANRGQLDSGLGRFETLYNDINSGNKVSTLNENRAKAINEIKNYITQAEAQANSDVASAKNSTANQLISLASLDL